MVGMVGANVLRQEPPSMTEEQHRGWCGWREEGKCGGRRRGEGRGGTMGSLKGMGRGLYWIPKATGATGVWTHLPAGTALLAL